MNPWMPGGATLKADRPGPVPTFNRARVKGYGQCCCRSVCQRRNNGLSDRGKFLSKEGIGTAMADRAKLFARFAEQERDGGDSWAATVVGSDYNDRPPPGRFLRCLHEGREAGCLWYGSTRATTQIRLNLSPEYWAHPLHGALVPALSGHISAATRWIELLPGSSTHAREAKVILAAAGFEPRPRSRVLMLKPLSRQI